MFIFKSFKINYQADYYAYMHLIRRGRFVRKHDFFVQKIFDKLMAISTPLVIVPQQCSRKVQNFGRQHKCLV